MPSNRRSNPPGCVASSALADSLPAVSWFVTALVLSVTHLTAATVEDLAERCRPSVVTITHADRLGNHNGMGTGVVIDSDGLIATSLHVIGEARPVQVRFSSGKSFPVTAIHAWDRKLDLAVIKIAAQQLQALPLGNSDSLRNGQSVIAIGNPMGLEQSIVTGVVSGVREFEHSDMIQLAIPIEPGNSGGPLLDREGHVHGLLNLKSVVTDNLGFATPVNRLKLLLEKPNTVPIDRWLRIGALDPAVWETHMGARWSQLTGRIRVSGSGSGFGGRALCLHKTSPEQQPYEIAVSVKLNNESGAAGLVFGADGGDRHYGFYPSNGQIRLTRFDGANVFSWNILHQISSEHYRNGDWNHLRIRHSSNQIEGYLNGHLILTSTDQGLTRGQVGLAKFRDTEAEFKGFQANATANERPPAPSGIAPVSLTEEIGSPSDLDNEALLAALKDRSSEGQDWLRAQAQRLELEAQRLRQASESLHRISITDKLVEELNRPEASIDLLRAALLVAKHDKPELPTSDYLAQLQRMADEIRSTLDPSADETKILDALTHYLFRENGFHGSYFDYRNNANSYLDSVIDDREGLPITLSVLFLELGRRLNINGLTGFPLPYHFLVKHTSTEGDYRLIDVFNYGEELTYEDANRLVARSQNNPFRSQELGSASKREIITRMLRNLQSFTREEGSLAASLPYLDLLLAINPSHADLYLERAWVHLRTGNSRAARTDLQWILNNKPPGINLPRVREALDSL